VTKVVKNTIKRLKPIVKISAKVLLILYLLYKFNIVSKTRVIGLIDKIKGINEEGEDSIFKKLEELNLPISIQKKKKGKKVIKIPEWGKTLIEIGIKLNRNRNSDPNDEKLAEDILRELEKLRKK